jgi:hypothetical protein
MQRQRMKLYFSHFKGVMLYDLLVTLRVLRWLLHVLLVTYVEMAYKSQI